MELWELQLVQSSKQNLSWGSKLVKSNTGCLYRLLGSKLAISGDKDVSLLPHTGRVPFSWEIHFLLSGGQKRV